MFAPIGSGLTFMKSKILGSPSILSGDNLLLPPSDDVIGFNSAAFSWKPDATGDDAGTRSSAFFTLRIDNELVFKRGRINLITGPTGSGILLLFIFF